MRVRIEGHHAHRGELEVEFRGVWPCGHWGVAPSGEVVVFDPVTLEFSANSGNNMVKGDAVFSGTLHPSWADAGGNLA